MHRGSHRRDGWLHAAVAQRIQGGACAHLDRQRECRDAVDKPSSLCQREQCQREQCAASTAKPSLCPVDMAEVKGAFCLQLEQRCLKHRKPWQCAEFDKPSRCKGERTAMHYCIDRYEYPNAKGKTPLVMQSWKDGAAACASVGKRLCKDAEWTLACEGPDELPFPYGYARDAERCAIDKKSPKVNDTRLFSKRTQDAELARLDQREPSGARASCVSAYGVFDQTGNVDEWVINESGRPHRSALKGGNWGEYRNACRPATRAHDEGFRYYQTGFRCCRDALPKQLVP